MTHPTVRDRAYEVLRAHGVTTVFGNPGFTEMAFLSGIPADFTYYLGLQEASVLGMAEGYAGTTGKPVLVNLHSAAGLGNAMGHLKTAFHAKTPLIVTAGQQRRDMCLFEPAFHNKEATDLPKPYVKWSYEPQRAQDVPAALARAIRIATREPQGPVYLSLPMDDWEREADPEPPPQRDVSRLVAPDPTALAAAAERIAAAERPALIVGAAIDRAGAWEPMIALAERLGAPVYTAPTSTRVSFPENHPLYRGGLLFDRAAILQRLAGHDLAVVIGAPVFEIYVGGNGPLMPDGCALIQFTDDPAEADRALEGDAVVGHVRLSLEGLLLAMPTKERVWPAPRPTLPPPDMSDPPQAHAVFSLLEGIRPHDSVLVLEAPSHAGAARMRMRITTPGGYRYAGVGGVGNGVPCAVGVQLADPSRRVVCISGDGSLLYSMQALWTAAQHRARVVTVVLDNGGYLVLKATGDFLGLGHAQPGLDTPGIDIVKIAEGFGVPAWRVTRVADVAAALERAFATDGPSLVCISVDASLRPLLS